MNAVPIRNEPHEMRDDDRQDDQESTGLICDPRILEGPIRSAVFWLGLPILGEQMLNACVTWNDAFLAGRISAEATGAVGFAGYIGWLMTMLFWLVGIGATAIISRAIGAKDLSEARRTTNQAFVMAAGLGLTGTVFVFLAAPGFALLLNMIDSRRAATGSRRNQRRPACCAGSASPSEIRGPPAQTSPPTRKPTPTAWPVGDSCRSGSGWRGPSDSNTWR